MNHDRQQRPYPPPPHRTPLTHPQQAPYQHHPHSGPPQPGWQWPTQQKKKSKTAWIIAGIVLVVAPAWVLRPALPSCRASTAVVTGLESRGDDGRAVKVPQKGWVEVYRGNPRSILAISPSTPLACG